MNCRFHTHQQTCPSGYENIPLESKVIDVPWGWRTHTQEQVKSWRELWGQCKHRPGPCQGTVCSAGQLATCPLGTIFLQSQVPAYVGTNERVRGAIPNILMYVFWIQMVRSNQHLPVLCLITRERITLFRLTDPEFPDWDAFVSEHYRLHQEAQRCLRQLGSWKCLAVPGIRHDGNAFRHRLGVQLNPSEETEAAQIESKWFSAFLQHCHRRALKANK